MAAMLSLPAVLSARVEAAAGIDPELRPATRPQFGHFQSNVALRLAKTQGRPPREVAASLVEQLDLSDLCAPLEIAGPGFINLKMADAALAAYLGDRSDGEAEQTRLFFAARGGPLDAASAHEGYLTGEVLARSIEQGGDTAEAAAPGTPEVTIDGKTLAISVTRVD